MAETTKKETKLYGYEELNKVAAELKTEGKEQELKELAKLHGIDEMDVEDYIDDIYEQLVTPLSMALGKIELQKNTEDKYAKTIIDIIASVLKNMLQHDERILMAVNKEGTNIADIYNEMRILAEKHMTGQGINRGFGLGVSDKQLQDIISAYYLESNADFKEKVAKLFE